MEKIPDLRSTSGEDHEYDVKNARRDQEKIWDFADLLFIKWVISLEQNNMRINIKVNKIFVY